MRVVCLLVFVACVAVQSTVLYTVRSANNDIAQWTDCDGPRLSFLDDCHPLVSDGVVVPDTMQCFGEVSERSKFEAMGFAIVEEEHSQPFQEINNWPDGYDNFEQLYAKFLALQANYPTLLRVFNLNSLYNTPLTHEGRPLYAVKVSENVDREEDEPNLLVVGNHHARELITPQLILDTAERLTSGFGTDHVITELLSNNQVYLIWNMNPDGLSYVWNTDNMWRKNRRPNGGNSFGVDQNRNYPIGWSLSCGGSTNPNASDYRGPSAASEGETLTMLAFQTERQFAKVLDFHSSGRDVRINYGNCATLPTNVDNFFAREAQSVASEMQYIQIRSCCMGGQIHVTYHDHGSLAFLVETGRAFQPPGEEMRQELVRVWPGTIYFLTRPIAVAGHIRNARTGQGVTANIDIPAITWNLNEQRRSYGDRWGRYHLWLPTGTYQATVTARGYRQENVVVTVVEGQTSTLDINLTEEGTVA